MAGAHHVNASHGVFSEVHGNMYNSCHYNYPNDSPNSDISNNVSYVPMPHNKLFTGCEAYLETLRQHFVPRDTCCPSRQFLVHSAGGAGKTQICLRLAEELTPRFWRIFWVDATTEETIELSLQAIASYPEARSFGVDRSAQSVRQWLGTVKHDWLIVFDNADDRVVKYIPPGNRGNILFTSRNPNLADLAADCIEINGMAEEDAISLLLKSSRIGNLSMEAREVAGPIVKELFCLPLAVNQAGAAIASCLCGLEDYLHIYRQHRRELLADVTFKGASGYGRAVYGTWDLSFSAISAMGSRDAESAILILRIFAFFHHENITEEIIKRAAEESKKRASSLPPQLDHLLQVDQNGDWDPFFFRGGLRILLSFSLIKKADIGGIHSLHPLVHCWIRDSMSNEERQLSSSFSCTLLASSVVFLFTSEEIAHRRTLIPHIRAVESGCGLRYNNEWYAAFAQVFYEAGHWKKAEGLCIELVKTNKRVLGEDHPETLATMSNLASTYLGLGRWKEAEALGIQVTEVKNKVLGAEHSETLASMDNLASTYRTQGRYKEAEGLVIEVMEMRKRVFGKEHPETLGCMDNLASTYRKQGQYKEAEGLLIQVVETSKKVLGEEHPNTLNTMHNLASTYWSQGRWKEAEELGIQVTETKKRVLGEEHPNTLISMNDLALTYLLQGRQKEAEELYNYVMEASKRVLGEDHPETLTNMINLASTYRVQKRYMEAEELGLQVAGMCKRVLGENHPNTLITMQNLAATYRYQGRYEEAEELYIRVMEIGKGVFGEEHPEMLISMNSLALTYSELKRWREAEELLIKVVETRGRVLGEDHPDTLASIIDLESTYRNRRQYKAAEKLPASDGGVREGASGGTS